MHITSQLKILEYSDGRVRSSTREFPCEVIINLYVNDKFKESFCISPSMVKEFALGHLVCEGLINSADQVQEIRVDGADIHVSTCESSSKSPSVKSNWHISLDTVLWTVDQLNSNSKVYGITKAVQIAILFIEKGKLLGAVEDIGRYNAVQKVIGEALIKGRELSKIILALSGRMPSDMISIISRAGIPIVISVAYPTSNGIEMARRLNLTLITVRDGKVFIHSSEGRVVLSFSEASMGIAPCLVA